MKPTTEYIFDVLVQEKRFMRSRLNSLQAKSIMYDKLGRRDEAEATAIQCREMSVLIDHFVETFSDMMKTVQRMEVDVNA